MCLFNIWKLSETQSYLVIGLAAVAFLCLVGIIVLSVKDKKSNKEKVKEEALEGISDDIEKIEDNDSSIEVYKNVEDNDTLEATKEHTIASSLEDADENTASDLIKEDFAEENSEFYQEEPVEEASNLDILSKEEDLVLEQDDENTISNAVQIVKKNTFIKVNYLKSFRAKLSMGKDEAREFYRIIKSHCLKFGLKSRVSWACETIYKGRKAFLKITIRGKNLNVNLALNPADFENTKYYFTDTSESKKYGMVPMRVKVKSPRGVKYVLELIDIMMQEAGLEASDRFDTSVILEDQRSLEENLELGLIKKVESIVESEDDLKSNVSLGDEDEDDDDEDDEDDESEEINEAVAQVDPELPLVLVSYIKSFRAKLSMASLDAREYYNIVKNHLLSYKLKSRMSWACETIYKGRIAYAKLSIRGKNLNVNLALNPNDFLGTKYFFKDSSESKKYETVPMRVKVKSSRSLKYALELIDIMMDKNSLKRLSTYEEVNTVEPIRSFDENLSLGLIKKLKGRKASLDEIEEGRITKDVLDTSYIPEVSADDMDELVIDNELMEMVKEIVETHKRVGKKGIINLDDINKFYEENEIVSIKTLKEKKLVTSNIGHVKCLARGRLKKSLIFELEDYSSSAIKMILLTGGEIR